jgi:hypothetical protein
MTVTIQQLTKAARRLLATAELHKNISMEHRAISKALGALADSHANTDPVLSKAAGDLSACHKRLSGHYEALSNNLTSNMEKPDDRDTDAGTGVGTGGTGYGADTGKSFSYPFESAGHFSSYGGQGVGVSSRTAEAIRMMGGDGSVDLISKSAWGRDELPPPAGNDDPLAKSSFSALLKK